MKVCEDRNIVKANEHDIIDAFVNGELSETEFFNAYGELFAGTTSGYDRDCWIMSVAEGLTAKGAMVIFALANWTIWLRRGESRSDYSMPQYPHPDPGEIEGVDWIARPTTKIEQAQQTLITNLNEELSHFRYMHEELFNRFQRLQEMHPEPPDIIRNHNIVSELKKQLVCSEDEILAKVTNLEVEAFSSKLGLERVRCQLDHLREKLKEAHVAHLVDA